MVTVSHFFECAEKRGTFYPEPGKCNDGTPRQEKREVRAHGDHNPRHGGQFFMASDKWHHLEGTYPRPGVFRMYLYDNFTKPLAAKDVTGRAVTKEDPNGREIEVFELKPTRDGTSLEARIRGAAAPPVTVTAKVKFGKNQPEQRFDFAFTELSKEPVAPPAAVTPAAAPKTAPVQAAAAPVASTKEAPSAAPVPTPAAPALPPVAPPAPVAEAPAPAATQAGVPMQASPAFPLADEELPTSAKELVALLNQRRQEADSLIKENLFAQIYVPAISGKGIALALENHVHELPDQRKARALAGIRRLVLSAWQLDFFGDLGNKEKLADTYKAFAAAVAEIESAYGGQ
jgi:hypothetical protein